MDLYDRQRELSLSVPDSVIVAGTGGVGFWVATFLTMSGVKKLYLIDPDALESHNLNRMALPLSAVGKPKVNAIREWLITLRPEAMVVASRIQASDAIMVTAEVLFDCTDDWGVREELYNWCAQNRVRYMRAGYDGGSQITVSATLPWANGTPQTRYDITPSWVVPAVIVAALACYQVIRPESANGTLSLSIEDLLEQARKAQS